MSTAARSPARSMAGPLVVRICAPISAATMFASVVLPSPGGPYRRTWSTGSSRFCAASMRIARFSLTRSWPANSSSRRGRTVDSSARSSSATSAVVIRSIVIGRGSRPNRTCERFYRSRFASHSVVYGLAASARTTPVSSTLTKTGDLTCHRQTRETSTTCRTGTRRSAASGSALLVHEPATGPLRSCLEGARSAAEDRLRDSRAQARRVVIASSHDMGAKVLQPRARSATATASARRALHVSASARPRADGVVVRRPRLPGGLCPTPDEPDVFRPVAGHEEIGDGHRVAGRRCQPRPGSVFVREALGHRVEPIELDVVLEPVAEADEVERDGLALPAVIGPRMLNGVDVDASGGARGRSAMSPNSRASTSPNVAQQAGDAPM